MSKIIGLDVGNKRVGVALADTEVKIASPHATFLRAKYAAEKQILDMIDQFSIMTVIVGLPLSEQGEETKQSEAIRKFIRRLSNRSSANFIYIDEYGTSLSAKQGLGIKGQAHRAQRIDGKIDALAACEILQLYLNQHME